MPRSSHSRVLHADPSQVWALISDPHHLPRWWPKVVRVEAVQKDAFTEVLRTQRGRDVRADFRALERDQQAMRLLWEQQVEGTPFAKVLRSAQTELSVEAISPSGQPDAPRAQVRIVVRQSLRGLLANLGGPLVKRASARTVEAALTRLEQLFE